MKYIDAEKLKEQIEQLKTPFKKDIEEGVYPTYLCALLDFEELINSLQQEQQKVDLEKEIDNVWNPHFNLGWDDNSLVAINHKGFESIAKHFFELGLNARKED